VDKTILKLVDKVFKADGVLAKYFPTYSPRQPQIEMAEIVCRCLLEGKNGLVEAGTGTGKSLGYAIAAALWSAHHQKKIVLSTFTVTLQNQLMDKDLPLVKRVLRDLGYEINFSVGKGRGHYICKRRMFEALAAPSLLAHPKYELLKQLVSDVGNFEKGDRSEIPEGFPAEFWREIRGDANDCLGQESPHYGGCFIQGARANLQAANIIVANHAMFFTDLQLKQKGAYGLFPEYDAVIFDEGHRIEDVFSKYFQKTASVREIEHLFNRCLEKRSEWAKKAIEGEIEQTIQNLKLKATRISHSVFSQLTQRMQTLNSHSELLKTSLLDSNPFVDVLEDYEDVILQHMKFQEWDNGTMRGLENMAATIARVRSDFEQLIFNKNSDKWANWIETRPAKQEDAMVGDVADAYQTTLSGAPIEANTVLAEALFNHKTCILTSATLTTSGNFDFVADRLGIKKFLGYQVSSPFDYENQSLLIIPREGPSPKDAEFNTYTVEKIKEVLTITQGRTFLLFTSFVQMRAIKEMLEPFLESQGIEPLLHTASADREELLNLFKSTEKAVLFGAESFWEGVDVPGDDLVCVVIVKLPFAVPTEPLVYARSKKIEDAGGDPFERFSIPGCILRLKQGFGRLIRTTSDKGGVVILDNRLLTKRFGRIILNSLPPARRSNQIIDLRKMI